MSPANRLTAVAGCGFLHHRRGGFTLIHVMVAISVSGVLMGLAAAWIHQALHFSSSIRQRQRHHAAMLRLAAGLRDEIQSSAQMSMSGDNELRLRSPGGDEVRYVLAPGHVSVEKRRGSEVLMRDRFELAPGAVSRWETGEMPERIALIVERGRTGSGNGNGRAEGNMPDAGTAPVDLHVRAGVRRWPAMFQE